MVNALVTKNFNDNIEYLQSSQKDLFEKLGALDSAIELGHYIEKYELVYENDYFDVFEKNTQNFLYGKSSLIHAELASQSINYELNEDIFKGFHTKDIDSDLAEYKQKKPFEDPLSGYAPILHYCKTNSVKNKTLETLDKFVFFGVGLGLHISSIHKKISSKVYFIVEDDLELFRLSLFTTNYAQLTTNSQLIFSVFEDNDEFSKTAMEFLDSKSYYNHYIKYFHLLSHSEDKHSQFHMIMASQAHLSFDYNVYLTQGLKPLDYIFDDYRFLDKALSFSDGKLDKKAFLLLGAGPSLQKNIEWLKKNHNKFVIVAVAATIEFLEKENISPDIIIHLDAYESSIELFKNIKSMNFVKDSICIFSDKTSSKVIDIFDKKNVFLFENGTNYIQNSMKPSAPCVGSIAYQILLILKVKNIYLLGLDLAVDSETGKTHIDSYIDIKTISIKDKIVKSDILGYSESMFAIEGNLRKEVFTNPRWKSSIDTINLSTSLLKQESQNISNLGDGAKFIDINPKDNSSIKLDNISSENMYNYLLDKCLSKSSQNMCKNERNNLNEKRLHAKKLLEIVMQYKENMNHSLSKTLYEIIDLEKILTNEYDLEKYQLSRVLDLYLKYILSYIVDFINSIELKEKEYHLHNLYLLLIDHILEIIEYYLNQISTKIANI
jgi:hypothetical protein